MFRRLSYLIFGTSDGMAMFIEISAIDRGLNRVEDPAFATMCCMLLRDLLCCKRREEWRLEKWSGLEKKRAEHSSDCATSDLHHVLTKTRGPTFPPQS